MGSTGTPKLWKSRSRIEGCICYHGEMDFGVGNKYGVGNRCGLRHDDVETETPSYSELPHSP